MAKQIVWTNRAKNDLVDILQYWINRNKSNTFSIKISNLINEQLNLIAEFPHIGRKTDISNINVKVIHKHLLYYEIMNEILYVLTIKHGSENPSSLKLN